VPEQIAQVFARSSHRKLKWRYGCDKYCCHRERQGVYSKATLSQRIGLLKVYKQGAKFITVSFYRKTAKTRLHH